MIIITAGTEYIDIDTLACAFAYRELQGLMNIKADIVLPRKQTPTVPNIFKELEYNTSLGAIEQQDMQYVLVDISDPEHIDHRIDKKKIIKIFDHHLGHEDFWQNLIGDKYIIQRVGACATLIWEEFIQLGLSAKISEQSADLLYTAIISNSLNLLSSTTSEKDRKALNDLKEYISLGSNWAQKYFKEIEDYTNKHPDQALRSETKVGDINGRSVALPQIEIWDGKNFIKKFETKIHHYLDNLTSQYAFLIVPSILDRKTYFIPKDSGSEKLLSKILKIGKRGKILLVDFVIQRKEIKIKLQRL